MLWRPLRNERFLRARPVEKLCMLPSRPPAAAPSIIDAASYGGDGHFFIDSTGRHSVNGRRLVA